MNRSRHLSCIVGHGQNRHASFLSVAFVDCIAMPLQRRRRFEERAAASAAQDVLWLPGSTRRRARCLDAHLRRGTRLAALSATGASCPWMAVRIGGRRWRLYSRMPRKGLKRRIALHPHPSATSHASSGVHFTKIPEAHLWCHQCQAGPSELSVQDRLAGLSRRVSVWKTISHAEMFLITMGAVPRKDRVHD